jgi:hypothetical protein
MVLDEEWRKNVLEKAFIYANYRWVASEKNTFHGYDYDGVLVNTPDVTYSSEKFQCGWWQVNQENIGLPYNWGGCSSIEDFEHGIAEGKFAGNVPDIKNTGFSKYTVGLDCSGLLTLCWKLPKKLSTKDIPTIAHPLESTNELLPGDILLKPASHVMIFIKFTDDLKTYAQIIDSTRSTGKVSHRTISIVEFLSYGYNGYRINL